MDNKLYDVKHIIHPLAELCIVCYTTGYMSEARNVIILILVLLFIFVGVGVAISRLGKSVNDPKADNGGFLQRIFYDMDESDATPSAKLTQKVPSPTPADTTYTFVRPTGTPVAPQGTLSVTPADQKGAPVAYSSQTAQAPSMQKGGTAEEIPATGTPTAAIFMALAGLATGIKLYRKA